MEAADDDSILAPGPTNPMSRRQFGAVCAGGAAASTIVSGETTNLMAEHARQNGADIPGNIRSTCYALGAATASAVAIVVYMLKRNSFEAE